MNASPAPLVPATAAPRLLAKPAAWAAASAGLLLAGVLGAAAWLPIEAPPATEREALFEIPKGTYARRMAGEQLEILPDTLHLTMVVKDVLLLRNLDEVPQIFGPVLIMPGQSFRLPFEKASTYSFACSAHASGQLSVVVAPEPAAGWPRLQWRVRTLFKGAA